MDDAFAALRRGRLVAVTGEDGAILCLAAESVTPETMGDLKRRSGPDAHGGADANRAAVLRINPTGADIVRVPVASHFNARLIRSLADPTHDLDNPMRGPFARSWDPVPAAVRAAVKLAKLGQLLPPWSPSRRPRRRAGDPSVSAADIEAYDEVAAVSLRPVSSARVPLRGAETTRVIAFRPRTARRAPGHRHRRSAAGPAGADPAPFRMFHRRPAGLLKCDCGEQLRGAIEAIARRAAASCSTWPRKARHRPDQQAARLSPAGRRLRHGRRPTSGWASTPTSGCSCRRPRCCGTWASTRCG